MVRAERQVVLDMCFSAFEKHQYYNIKDLVDITKQPVVSSTNTHKQTTPAHYAPCFVKFEQIAHNKACMPVHTLLWLRFGLSWARAHTG